MKQPESAPVSRAKRDPAMGWKPIMSATQHNDDYAGGATGPCVGAPVSGDIRQRRMAAQRRMHRGTPPNQGKP